MVLRRISELLFPPAEEEKAPHNKEQVALATCVVFLEAAKADSEFTEEERRHVLKVIAQRFALDEESAEELLREATAAHEDSTDLWRFTNAINKAYSPAEKIEIIEEVWRIVFSDGVLSAHEDGLAHQLRHLLNLNHPQLIEAKMKVLGELRGDS